MGEGEGAGNARPPQGSSALLLPLPMQCLQFPSSRVCVGGGDGTAGQSLTASWLPGPAEHQALNTKSKSFKMQYSPFHWLERMNGNLVSH